MSGAPLRTWCRRPSGATPRWRGTWLSWQRRGWPGGAGGMERGCRTGSLRRDNTRYPWYKRCMGRRRRHHQQRAPQPSPAAARAAGATAGLVLLFFVGVVETAGPTLCRQDPQLVASDGGTDPSSPVPVETWADAAWGERLGRQPFPPPAPGQQRPPCPVGTMEATGGCWERAQRAPPCLRFQVEDSGACYMAVPTVRDAPGQNPLSSPP